MGADWKYVQCKQSDAAGRQSRGDSSMVEVHCAKTIRIWGRELIMPCCPLETLPCSPPPPPSSAGLNPKWELDHIQTGRFDLQRSALIRNVSRAIDRPSSSNFDFNVRHRKNPADGGDIEWLHADSGITEISLTSVWESHSRTVKISIDQDQCAQMMLRNQQTVTGHYFQSPPSITHCRCVNIPPYLILPSSKNPISSL